jgi:ATP-binding cassette subfamily F protein uup
LREWQKLKEEAPEVQQPILSVKEPEVVLPKKKLSYKEQREFELLENELKTLEKERATLYTELSNSSLPYDKLQEISARINIISKSIDDKELRWLELSDAQS